MEILDCVCGGKANLHMCHPCGYTEAAIVECKKCQLRMKEESSEIGFGDPARDSIQALQCRLVARWNLSMKQRG